MPSVAVTSVAVVVDPPLDAATVAADVVAAGFEVVLAAVMDTELPDAVLAATPDVLVAVTPNPSDTLLDLAATLKNSAPCTVVVFTDDADPGTIERAAASGVHAYVVDGYTPARLRAVIEVAAARFRQGQATGVKLDDLSRTLRDRKQVERAKGILMRSRGLGEAAAFALMRSLAMRRRLRLVSVAAAVIDLSVGAEAVNRSGQLRMLAQRTARCLVQLAFGVQPSWAAANLRDCRERIENNIALLRRTVGDRGCGPDIERVARSWAALRAVADAPPAPAGLADADALAETLTRNAEQLTALLESAGTVTSLRVVNLSGRQRMLSQRVGKLCLLLALDDAGPALLAARAAALRAAAAEFEAALRELAAMPLRTPGITRWLGEAEEQWAAMEPFGTGQGAPDRCVEVCESLLAAVDALTGEYEEAAQVLVGDRMQTLTDPEPA